jgi:hypothetical protein
VPPGTPDAVMAQTGTEKKKKNERKNSVEELTNVVNVKMDPT